MSKEDIDDIDIDLLLSKINIVDYISQYAELVPRNGCLWCNSLFNTKDYNPSFCVEEDKQLFYCFSTHIGGNVINFVMNYHNVSFHKAVYMLCDYIGSDGQNLKNSTLSALKEIKKYQKHNNEKITKHNILSPDIMDTYINNDKKLSIWADEGISYESMKNHQVRYDILQDRIVFPIKDIDGNIINISGRTLDKQYKEKKIRKYTYYYKFDSLDLIYNLDKSRDCAISNNEIILFEGVKSVLLCETWGINNTGALLTSSLNEQQMKILIKLGCNVIFALDEDVDILKDKRINFLKKFVNVSYIKNFDNLLSEKQSPVDAGFEVFKKLFDNKKSFI